MIIQPINERIIRGALYVLNITLQNILLKLLLGYYAPEDLIYQEPAPIGGFKLVSVGVANDYNITFDSEGKLSVLASDIDLNTGFNDEIEF